MIMQYLRHIAWMLFRPLIHPFWEMRRHSRLEREAELTRYKHEQRAAIQELKLELLLAHRQGVRGQTQQEGEDE